MMGLYRLHDVTQILRSARYGIAFLFLQGAILTVPSLITNLTQAEFNCAPHQIFQSRALSVISSQLGFSVRQNYLPTIQFAASQHLSA